jgi:hypothetical protein
MKTPGAINSVAGDEISPFCGSITAASKKQQRVQLPVNADIVNHEVKPAADQDERVSILSLFY